MGTDRNQETETCRSAGLFSAVIDLSGAALVFALHVL